MQRSTLAWHRTALAAVTAAAVLTRHAWDHVGVLGVVPLVLAVAASGLAARRRVLEVSPRGAPGVGTTAACLATAVALTGVVEVVARLGVAG